MKEQLKVWNTLTRQKEVLKPIDGKVFKMYTCGPTVYNYAHIGNFRTYVFEDLLRRVIKFFGFEVKQVMNFTDVDDKTIKGALLESCSLEKYTKKYKDIFLQDLKELNIEDVEFRPSATEYISEMIRIIEALLDKGFAYVGNDSSVYFKIQNFKDYGKLSHLKLKDLKVGASNRVNSDEYDKENISDFVLWKSYDKERDGNIFWESPFGKGRPGWHLECSAMAINLLGESIDIHCGGIDNIFPHHENEIAQSEAYTEKKFVNYWIHSDYLIVDNKKMSKSLGNFYTLRDLLKKGYTGREVRYSLLQTHYRSQLNFTFEGLNASKAALSRLDGFIIRLKEIKLKEGIEIDEITQRYKNNFVEAISDDLNISKALGVLFDFVREVNLLMDKELLNSLSAEKCLNLLKSLNIVLGIFDFKEEDIPENLLQALSDREKARKERNFQKADQLRDFITNSGYIIEDTRSGARLKKV